MRSVNPLRYESVEGKVLRDVFTRQNARMLRALASRDALVTPGGPDRPTRQVGSPGASPGLHAEPGIPRILYQTWKTRGDLPPNYAYWRETFEIHNPDFELLLWDDGDNRSFVEAEFPSLLGVYDGLPSEIYRVDLVRPLFLFRYGGFYADLDTECLRSLEVDRQGHDVLLARLGPESGFRHSIPNAIMASVPLQLFWLFYVAVIIDGLADRDSAALLALGPEDITGPVALKRAADAYLADPSAARLRATPLLDQLPADLRDRVVAGRLDLLPLDAWYPFDWNNKIHARLRTRLLDRRQVLRPEAARALFPRASVVTYWTAGWKRS